MRNLKFSLNPSNFVNSSQGPLKMMLDLDNVEFQMMSGDLVWLHYAREGTGFTKGPVRCLFLRFFKLESGTTSAGSCCRRSLPWKNIASIPVDAIAHPPFSDIISFPLKCPYFAHVSKKTCLYGYKSKSSGFILSPALPIIKLSIM